MRGSKKRRIDFDSTHNDSEFPQNIANSPGIVETENPAILDLVSGYDESELLISDCEGDRDVGGQEVGVNEPVLNGTDDSSNLATARLHHDQENAEEVIDLSLSSPLTKEEPQPEHQSDTPILKMPESRTVKLIVNCLLPGKPPKQELEWKDTTTFYILEDTYGRSATISYKDKVIPHFLSPAYLDRTADTLEILVSSLRQFKEMQLRKTEGSHDQEEPESTGSADQFTAEVSEFPITLQGKPGRLQVRVSSKSKVHDLVNYYLQKHNVNSQRAYATFDGDKVSPHTTVGELELETDDNLDIYID